MRIVFKRQTKFRPVYGIISEGKEDRNLMIQVRHNVWREQFFTWDRHTFFTMLANSRINS